MSIFEWDREEYLRSEREVWFEEGIEIGRAIVLAQFKVRVIIELLEELGDIPGTLRARLESETDAERLSKLLKMAARSKDIPHFAEVYETMGEVECQ